MKPALFDLERPDSVEAALAMLADQDVETRPLAGGQSLVPLMNFRLSRPDRLVSLNHLPELARIDTDGDELVIGAMVRQRAAEQSPVAAEWCPLLRETLDHVAHPPIRNRGTIGGSIAHADPSAELPALAAVMRARLVLRGPGGQRTVGARDFFLGPYETAMVPGELLTEVRLPRVRPGQGHAVVEVARRRGDFALAGALAVVEVAGGRVTAADLAFFGVGSCPIVSEEVAQLAGAEPTEAVVGEVAQAAASAITPVGDLHASPRFRAHLTAVVARRALARAVARATGGDDR
jgi:aerobic carbon-monoxide dehydrogenase medium subunit